MFGRIVYFHARGLISRRGKGGSVLFFKQRFYPLVIKLDIRFGFDLLRFGFDLQRKKVDFRSKIACYRLGTWASPFFARTLQLGSPPAGLSRADSSQSSLAE